MPRFRTAAVATLLVVPIVAGGFLIQKKPAGPNAILLDQTMSLIKNAYVDTIPTNAIYEKAAKGLVGELNDLYSVLLPPRQAENFNRETGGRYGGTGMLLGSPSNGVVTGDRVFPNTPAEAAGVREGDFVVSVDSVKVKDV